MVWYVQQVQEVRQVLRFPSVLHLPGRKDKNHHSSRHFHPKVDLLLINITLMIYTVFLYYSQGFQAVLSLQGSLSVLGVRLYRGLRGVQGLPWFLLSLRDQKVPALQVDLGVQGGRARPWGRSLLMDPGRKRKEH